MTDTNVSVKRLEHYSKLLKSENLDKPDAILAMNSYEKEYNNAGDKNKGYQLPKNFKVKLLEYAKKKGWTKFEEEISVDNKNTEEKKGPEGAKPKPENTGPAAADASGSDVGNEGGKGPAETNTTGAITKVNKGTVENQDQEASVNAANESKEPADVGKDDQATLTLTIDQLTSSTIGGDEKSGNRKGESQLQKVTHGATGNVKAHNVKSYDLDKILGEHSKFFK